MYIGLYKIKEEKPFSHTTKTASGDKHTFEYVEVEFESYENDQKETIEVQNRVFPLAIMDDLRTQEPMDHNFVRDIRLKAASEDIQLVMLQHEIGVEEEIQDVIRFMNLQFNKSIEKMEEIRWGKPKTLVSLRDVDKVLMG